jgi:hypothetical protein
LVWWGQVSKRVSKKFADFKQGQIVMTISKTDPVDQVQEANPTLTKVQIRQTVETIGHSIKFCLES